MDSAEDDNPAGDSRIVQVTVGTTIDQMQRALIMATLRHCEGNKTRAAAVLGISLKTLYNRLNEYRREARSDAHPAQLGQHDSRPDR
ncbi:MAG: helix-turn-helix domain-containing protein [Pseudomonadota bacterium]